MEVKIMIVVKIYGLLWLLVMAAAVTVYLTGSLGFGTTMVLGFVASVLAGAGMLTAYPALMAERVSPGRNA
jgi:hypothetical protein